MTTATEGIMEGLERAKEDLRREYESRSAAIDAAMAALANPWTNRRHPHPDAPPKPFSISEEKVRAVLTFLKEHGPSRQADIAAECIDPATGQPMNSGSVSVALRVLAQRAMVQSLDRRNGSRVWDVVSAPG